MQRIVNTLREVFADPLDSSEIFDSRPGYPAQSSELLQENLAPFRTETRDRFQCRYLSTPSAPLPMSRDGKSMRLVPDLLNQMQGR